MTRTFVIHPVVGDPSRLPRDPNESLAEALGLAAAISLEVTGTQLITIGRLTPATLFGSGQVVRLGEFVAANTIDLVFVDHALSPVQQRNLEKQWQCKVIDRTGLILEIFGARAKTREGIIQVELAALQYQRSRLVRSWTHLERQRGGAGFMGGPGETQIELDRRLIDDRIAALKKELETVKRTRRLQRDQRQKVPFPVVALVGYTNAGKSTLFNRLTRAPVYADDLLFATLDPTVRRLHLPNKQSIMLSDTVGFISDLPTALIASFRATLEQVEDADLILHVRDIATSDSAAQQGDVQSVLKDLGIDPDTDPRLIEVWNKLDAFAQDDQADIRRKASRQGRAVCVSALTGEGCDDLIKTIEAALAGDRVQIKVTVQASDGKTMAWLHRHGVIVTQRTRLDRLYLTVDLPKRDADRFLKTVKQ